MITKWKVSNFKSIRKETELELGPLTIFAGANSSGKSTFIQSILLIAQTLANKIGSRSVVLNGTLTNLGQFDDLKSIGGESDQITIQCTCKPLNGQGNENLRHTQFSPRGTAYYSVPSNSLKEIACEISFDADPSNSQRDLFQIQPHLFSTQLSCISRDEDNIDQKTCISISRKPINALDPTSGSDEIDDQLRASLDYATTLDDNSLSEVRDDFRSAKPIGCALKHFLPVRVVYSIDPVEEDVNTITLALQDGMHRPVRFRRSNEREIFLSQSIISVLREILKETIDVDDIFKDQQPSLLAFEAEAFPIRAWFERVRTLPMEDRMKVQEVLRKQENLFSLIYEAAQASTPKETERQAIVQQRPPRLITEAAWYIDNFFSSSLKYLGPLRDAPKPLYPLAPGADPQDVGLRGEQTVSILELHKSQKIQYIPSENFKNSVIGGKTITRSLETAVIDWLQYLGVANSVKSKDMGKLGHELKVKISDDDEMHDLTHVGVGVSQVLPILVMCLLADTDTTLVFEQPELHLHPKVQSLLGDFFLSMALCNKQCIVETHSEYLIDRLRFRIAAAPEGNKLEDLAKIYFAKKDKLESTFDPVKVNEYGAITNWPDGFFDQSQELAEEILKAAIAKKQAKNNKRKD